MIKRFIRRVLGLPSDVASRVPREKHGLAREAISVPGRCYGQTSRFELAEWKTRHERDGVQLVVGLEQGFSGARYIRHRFAQDCPTVPLVASLEEACRAVVELMRAELAVPTDCDGIP